MPQSNEIRKSPGEPARQGVDAYTLLGRRPPVFSPSEELAAAREIQRLRNAIWSELCSYPRLADAIGLFITERLEESLPLLSPWLEAADGLRRSRSRATRTKFLQATGALANELGEADPDRRLSMELSHEVRQLATGRHARLGVASLRRTAALRAYVERVGAAEQRWREIKQDFVARNVGLVFMEARRYRGRGTPLADLVHEGVLGLLKAVDRFDPERGFRFSTYGAWWIRHDVERAVANRGRQVRVPVHLITVGSKMAKASRRLASRAGREPSLSEIAREIGEPVEKLRRARRALGTSVTSLETGLGHSEDGLSPLERLAGDSELVVEDAIDAYRLRDDLQRALQRLSAVKRDVLEKRFGLDGSGPKTLREIGEEYSLSRERIRQIEGQALEEARRHLGAAVQ